MKTKFKVVRFVLAATFGSLLWAGCATERAYTEGTYYGDASAAVGPVDLTDRRPSTHPELQNPAQENAGWNRVHEVPVGAATITEAAGAERR